MADSVEREPGTPLGKCDEPTHASHARESLCGLHPKWPHCKHWEELITADIAHEPSQPLGDWCVQCGLPWPCPKSGIGAPLPSSEEPSELTPIPNDSVLLMRAYDEVIALTAANQALIEVNRGLEERLARATGVVEAARKQWNPSKALRAAMDAYKGES